MFEISARTEYGTRALLEMARNWGKAPLGLNQIAARQDVSFKYLEQIMLLLRKGGIVRAGRGRTGGYMLTRPPSEITIAEVVTALEGPLRLMDCSPDLHSCAFVDTCLLRYLWHEMERALDGIMSSRTLADLMPGQKNRLVEKFTVVRREKHVASQ